MCSSLLRLDPGSRDLSQVEQRIKFMKSLANSHNDKSDFIMFDLGHGLNLKEGRKEAKKVVALDNNCSMSKCILRKSWGKTKLYIPSTIKVM